MARTDELDDKILNAAISLLLPALLIILWEVSVRTGLLPIALIPTVSEVAYNFFDSIISGKLLFHSWVSLKRLLYGFFLGGGAAIVLGALVGTSKLFEKIFSPTIQALSPVPVIAWTPLLIILFNIDGARIALIAVGCFFIVYFGTFQGIRSTDQKFVEIGEIFGKGKFDVFVHILFPSSLPNILSSCRLALAIGWILVLSGEVIASSSGLGWLIWNSRNFSRPDDMVVGMVAVGILGKITDSILSFLQNRLLSWRSNFQG